jgi:hypothetical protein
LKLYGAYGQMGKFFDDKKKAFPEGVKNHGRICANRLLRSLL